MAFRLSGGAGAGRRRGGVSLSAVRGALILIGLVVAVWSLFRTAGPATPRVPLRERMHARDALRQRPVAARATPAPPQLSAEDMRRIIREEVRAALAEATPVAVVTDTHALLGTSAPVAHAVDALPPPARARVARAASPPPAVKALVAAAAAPLPGGAPSDTRGIHVIVTADSSPYLQWQMRVCYFWYLRAAAQPGSPFRAFTRVLHTGKPDALMSDIPTVVVPEGPRPDNGGPPIQRPAAVIAWLAQAPPAEEYVLMLEPDHIILRPMPLGAVARGRPVAFMFSYVDFAVHEAALAPHLAAAGCTAAQAPRTGNSPSLMHRDDLAALAPGWRDVSLALHEDAAVREAVGWVGEMYGFSIAACAAGLRFALQEQELMLHPPFDAEVGEASLIHYTYGTELMANGTVADPNKVAKAQRVWAFDKRYFQRDYPEGRITPPPDGAPPSVVRLVDSINEALDAHAVALAAHDGEGAAEEEASGGEAESEAERQAEGEAEGDEGEDGHSTGEAELGE